MPPGTRRTQRDLLIALGTFVLWIAAVTIVRFSIIPAIGPTLFVDPLGNVQEKALPFFTQSFAQTYDMTVPVLASRISVRSVSIQVDDCIEQLTVNGEAVIPVHIPRFCSAQGFRDIPLGKYLRTGMNELSFRLSDGGGRMGLALRASQRDPLLLGTLVVIAGLTVWFALRLLSLFGVRVLWSGWTPVVLLVLSGAFLRALYVSATPYSERSHDWGSHVEYIEYVASNWSIPAAATGWEYHQAPLYYFLSAGWMYVTRILGFSRAGFLLSLEYWSLVLSVLSLVFAVLAVLFLLPRTSRAERILSAALLATLTGFLFFSSRITNEVLSSMLGFASIALLLQWWKSGSDRIWYALCVLLCLAFLTKVSLLLLFPVVFLCLLLRPGEPLSSKVRTGFLSALLIFLLAGWLPVYRFLEADSRNVTTLGNQSMHGGLKIPVNASRFTTFNPAAVIRFPFNDTWSDKWRREYFPEFFLKSAFFGEFSFERFTATAQIIVLFALLLLIPLLVGFVTDILTSPVQHAPIHFLMLVLLAAAVAYPAYFSYAPNQDFRQSILLVVPGVYYLARGISLLPSNLRFLFLVFGFTFAALSGAFVLTLFLTA